MVKLSTTWMMSVRSSGLSSACTQKMTRVFFLAMLFAFPTLPLGAQSIPSCAELGGGYSDDSERAALKAGFAMRNGYEYAAIGTCDATVTAPPGSPAVILEYTLSISFSVGDPFFEACPWYWPSNCLDNPYSVTVLGPGNVSLYSAAGNITRHNADDLLGPPVYAGPSLFYPGNIDYAYSKTFRIPIDISTFTAEEAESIKARVSYDHPNPGTPFYYSFYFGGELRVRPPVSVVEIGFSDSGDQSHQTMYKGDNDWRSDSLNLLDAYMHPIETIVWKDSDADGRPETNDPVAYISGAKVLLTQVRLRLQRPPTGIMTNVLVRVEDNLGTLFGEQALSFADVSATFLLSSEIQLANLQSVGVLPNGVQNFDLELRWSVSFDGGQTFIVIGTTGHRIFTVLDRIITSHPQAWSQPLATRVDLATSEAFGAASKQVAVEQVAGTTSRYSPGVGDNPVTSKYTVWDAIQNAKSSLPPPPEGWGFQCIGLAYTAMHKLQLLGIYTDTDIAYPTGAKPLGDKDATREEALRGEEVTTDGGTKVRKFLEGLVYGTPAAYSYFEGYLRFRSAGSVFEKLTLVGYTLFPLSTQPIRRNVPSTVNIPDIVSAEHDNKLSYNILRSWYGVGAGNQMWVDEQVYPAVIKIPVVPLP